MTVPDVEGYYNIRTVNELFDVKTSYISSNDQILFPLSNIKSTTLRSNFKPIKGIEVEIDPISLRSLENKRKFLTFNIIADNMESSQPLKELFSEYLINLPRFCDESKIIFLLIFISYFYYSSSKHISNFISFLKNVLNAE